MTNASSERGPRGSARKWSLALAALALIVALLVAGGILSGVGRRDRALARIRERGEPLRPSELASGSPTAGNDAIAWMREVDAQPEGEEPEQIVSQLCPERIAEGGDLHELTERLEAAVWDIARIDGLEACELALVERELAGQPDALSIAAKAAEHGRPDVGCLLDAKPLLSGVAALPLSGAMRAARLLGSDAVLAASEGDEERALARLEQLFDVADVLAGLPLLLTHTARVWILGHAVSASVRVAAILPEASDLSAIEERLAGTDPAAELRSALVGERAFGIALYEELHGDSSVGLPLDEVGSFRSVAFRVLLAHDQADYLEEMERAIDASEQGPPPVESMEWKPRFYSCVSAMMLPHWDWDARRAASLEARLQLAQAVLLARRTGAREAIEWIRARTDPLDGKPLRARLDEARVLWLWSVGEDGQDNGGTIPDPADPLLQGDLVARTRPAAER